MLYISYNGLGEPLVHSQVLPYLRGLAAAGFSITLLTFERRGAGQYVEQQQRALAELQRCGITSRRLWYHRRPSFVATLFDAIQGFIQSASIVRSEGSAMVHARSYVPAMIGLWVQRMFGIRLLFDMRGMMADEYVDAGNWKRDGFLYRLTKRMERRLLRAADEIVVLTHRIKQEILVRPDLPPDVAGRISVIPCCVDVDKFQRADLPPVGEHPGSTSGEKLMVYCGSVGTWYLLDEMLDFFAACPDPNAKLLFLNQGEHPLIESALTRKGLDRSRVTIVAALPDEVPGYLARADLGLSFIKPTFSKRASSPTKLAEYLAMGLPVAVNAGVGDVDDIVRQHGVGAVVTDLTPQGYRHAWDEVQRRWADPGVGTRCRQLAREEFSVEVGTERYKAIYARMMSPASAHAVVGWS